MHEPDVIIKIKCDIMDKVALLEKDIFIPDPK